MTHLDALSDEQAFRAHHEAAANHRDDSYDVYLAEEEAKGMAAKGLIKVTKGPRPSHLSLLKGKPTANYDGPMEINL